MAAQIHLPPPSCLGMVGSAYPFAAGSTGSSSTQPIVICLSSRVGHQALRPQHRTSTYPALWSITLHMLPRTSSISLVLMPRTSTHPVSSRSPNFHTSLVNNRPTLPHATVMSLTDARVGMGDDGSGGDYLSFSIVERYRKRSSCNLLLNHKSSPHCLLSPLSLLTVFVFLVWYIKR